MLVGDNVKKYRTDQKMTLSELSNISKVQLATLSRIEHKKMVGTVDCHTKIAQALGIDLSLLYQTSEPTSIQNEQIAEVSIRTHGVSLEVLTSQTGNKCMSPILIKIEPRSETPVEKSQKNTEKFLYILNGKASIKIGEQLFPLSTDQSIYFQAYQEHQILNPSNKQIKILSVTSNK